MTFNKKSIRWILLNAFIWFCAVRWCLYGEEWFGNCVKFILVLSLIGSSLGSQIKESKEAILRAGRSVPQMLSGYNEVLMALFLAGFSHFWLASFIVVNLSLIEGIYREGELEVLPPDDKWK